MPIKGKIQLRSLLLILITFTFVTLLINDTHDITMYWHLYVIPLFIAALTYDLIGGFIVGILSAVSIFFWLYVFQYIFTSNALFPPIYQEKLLEIGLGMALFLVMGIALGHTSGKQKAQQAMLEGLSIRDRLTGLFNYGYFLDYLEKEYKRALRYQNPLAIVMMDVDHFKKFNDTYGHEMGNVVLKRVARIITKSIRNVDTAARYGGEEFIVTLPNANCQQAQTVAERIRKAIEKESFEVEGQKEPVKVTISGGIACYPAQAQDIDSLVFKADQALYAAKDGGRNQICLFKDVK